MRACFFWARELGTGSIAAAAADDWEVSLISCPLDLSSGLVAARMARPTSTAPRKTVPWGRRWRIPSFTLSGLREIIHESALRRTQFLLSKSCYRWHFLDGDRGNYRMSKAAFATVGVAPNIG